MTYVKDGGAQKVVHLTRNGLIYYETKRTCWCCKPAQLSFSRRISWEIGTLID